MSIRFVFECDYCSRRGKVWNEREWAEYEQASHAYTDHGKGSKPTIPNN